jgi:hypothetical protein
MLAIKQMTEPAMEKMLNAVFRFLDPKFIYSVFLTCGFFGY